jgi:hypothetical protein
MIVVIALVSTKFVECVICIALGRNMFWKLDLFQLRMETDSVFSTCSFRMLDEQSTETRWSQIMIACYRNWLMYFSVEWSNINLGNNCLRVQGMFLQDVSLWFWCMYVVSPVLNALPRIPSIPVSMVIFLRLNRGQIETWK